MINTTFKTSVNASNQNADIGDFLINQSFTESSVIIVADSQTAKNTWEFAGYLSRVIQNNSNYYLVDKFDIYLDKFQLINLPPLKDSNNEVIEYFFYFNSKKWLKDISLQFYTVDIQFDNNSVINIDYNILANAISEKLILPATTNTLVNNQSGNTQQNQTPQQVTNNVKFLFNI